MKLLIITVVNEFLILDTDFGAFADRLGNECVTADNNAFLNDGLAAEDRCTGVDRNIILDRWMSAHIAQLLTTLGRERTERHALIQLDMFPDDRCLTDYDTGSVINKEIFADRGTRMDIDTGLRVCLLRHHTRNQRHIQ